MLPLLPRLASADLEHLIEPAIAGAWTNDAFIQFPTRNFADPLWRRKEMIMAKVAVLDDWQEVARKSADWSPLAARAELVSFPDAFRGEDEAAVALADFDVLLTMRERTAFPETLVCRLQKLRMISITAPLSRHWTSRPAPARAFWFATLRAALRAPLTPRLSWRSAC
jgi:hypothetical protein